MEATQVNVQSPPSPGDADASPDGEKAQEAQPFESNIIKGEAVDAKGQGVTSLLSAEQERLLNFAEDLAHAAEASGYVPYSLVERAEDAIAAIVQGLRSFANLFTGSSAEQADNAFGVQGDEEPGAIQSRTELLEDGHRTNDASKDAREQAALSAPMSPGGDFSAQFSPDGKAEGDRGGEKSEGAAPSAATEGASGLGPNSSGVKTTSATRAEDDSSFHSVDDNLQDREDSTRGRFGEPTISSMPTRSSATGKSSAREEDSEESDRGTQPNVEERLASPEDKALQRGNEGGAAEGKDAVIAVPHDDKAAEGPGAEPPRQQGPADANSDAELRSKCVGFVRVFLCTAAALVCVGVIAGVYMSTVTTTTTKEDTTLPFPEEGNATSYTPVDEEERDGDAGVLTLDVAER
ncbi:hypothetical protein V5799_006478 [Amblyomma americanum]|uniref:Transmembrane protein n=1 Tax=Amblyomma americanum TaxID=6943 RepID=A0AAQ4DWA0_AMBAM